VVVTATPSVLRQLQNLVTVYGILSEDGICTNENVTKTFDDILNRDHFLEEFFKNLLEDKTLAEQTCQNMINKGVVK